MVSGPDPPVRVSTRSSVSPWRRRDGEYRRSTVALGLHCALTSRFTRAPSPTLSPPKKASGAQSSQIASTCRPCTDALPSKFRVVVAVAEEDSGLGPGVTSGTVVAALGDVGAGDSLRHEAEQPPPLTLLPSSHCSPGSRAPFSQRIAQTLPPSTSRRDTPE